MSLTIQTNNDYDLECSRVEKDLLYIWQSKMFINEKGYLQKLVDLLWNLGYYKRNESLFIRKGD